MAGSYPQSAAKIEALLDANTTNSHSEAVIPRSGETAQGRGLGPHLAASLLGAHRNPMRDGREKGRVGVNAS